ncbi:dual specificity protein phosphatase 16 [Amia ocellicauda]|uniref:dual specificity protein phosphatase 16 n=1 Tax=Amia ocellicauda TaxID=2972642 RepID=UPI003463CC69|nr:DUS8 phosphatase [Amia calva]
MVIYTEIHRPHISLILPRLYLGAQSDVTKDCLSSLGISDVLSVSRCCPQPSFLSPTRFLRVPIDDSLNDQLLPWLPLALLFIDQSRGQRGGVLVHCAAGVSRSAALAVAYVMHHLGQGLDDAYRFVKDRRPSISPNFNFLGQLQHFQIILAQRGRLINRCPLSLPPACSMSNYCAGLCPTDPRPANQKSPKDSDINDYDNNDDDDNNNKDESDDNAGKGERAPTIQCGSDVTIQTGNQIVSLGSHPCNNSVSNHSYSCSSFPSPSSMPHSLHFPLSSSSLPFSISQPPNPLPQSTDTLRAQRLSIADTQTHISTTTFTRIATCTRTGTVPTPSSSSYSSPSILQTIPPPSLHSLHNPVPKSPCPSPSQPKPNHRSPPTETPPHTPGSLSGKRRSLSLSLSLSLPYPSLDGQQGGHNSCLVAEEATEDLIEPGIPVSTINLTLFKLVSWGERLLLGSLLGTRVTKSGKRGCKGVEGEEKGRRRVTTSPSPPLTQPPTQTSTLPTALRPRVRPLTVFTGGVPSYKHQIFAECHLAGRVQRVVGCCKTVKM